MNKSMIRHILTALGAVLAFIGLGKFTGLITILTDNLDIVWSAVMSIVGVITSIIGFFKDKERFNS